MSWLVVILVLANLADLLSLRVTVLISLALLAVDSIVLQADVNRIFGSIFATAQELRGRVDHLEVEVNELHEKLNSVSEGRADGDDDSVESWL